MLLRTTTHDANGRPLLEVEMRAPSRWCRRCDEIRTPEVCGRCGAATVGEQQMDAELLAKFRARLARLVSKASPQA